MRGCRKAFSLAELVLVAMLLGVMAYVAVPKLQSAILHKQKADSTAQTIVTDLRLARRLAIAHAATNVAGYALNMTGESPYSGYQIENLDTSEIVETGTIDSQVSCTGGSDFQFGPLGNLLTGSDTQLTVSADGKSFTITVISATGAVKCAEN